MFAYELKRKLMNIPDNMEVIIHHAVSSKLYRTSDAYIGNEKYIPKGKQDKPDVFVIETK